MLSKSIVRAQRKVEERNFQIRKNLLEYDEVMDDFPQAKAEVEAAIAERVQKSVDEIDYESRSRELVDYFVERLVLEAVQEKLDSGHLSNPTFAPLWFRLRTREPVLRRLFDGIPLDEERETA